MVLVGSIFWARRHHASTDMQCHRLFAGSSSDFLESKHGTNNAKNDQCKYSNVVVSSNLSPTTLFLWNKQYNPALNYMQSLASLGQLTWAKLPGPVGLPPTLPYVPTKEGKTPFHNPFTYIYICMYIYIYNFFFIHFANTLYCFVLFNLKQCHIHMVLYSAMFKTHQTCGAPYNVAIDADMRYTLQRCSGSNTQTWLKINGIIAQ
jgi:hypothetical protein